MRPPAPRRRPGRPAGATLVELVLALAVSSVLLLGMGSALLVAVRSAPNPDASAATPRRLDDALRRLCGELAVALTLPEQGASAVTLVRADPAGGGATEAVRWWREDAPGAPLLRRAGAGPVEEVTGPLDAFEMGWTAAEHAWTHPGVPVRGDERLLASFEGSSGAEEVHVAPDRLVALPLIPRLPPDAVAWEPAEVSLFLRDDHEGVRLLVSLHPWLGDQPGARLLAQLERTQEQLPVDKLWHPLRLEGGPERRVPAGGRLCLVLEAAGHDTDHAARVAEAETTRSPIDRHRESPDGGASWSADDEKTLLHRLTGRAWTPGPAWSHRERRVGAVAVRLVSKSAGASGGEAGGASGGEAGGASGREARAQVRPLNGPPAGAGAFCVLTGFDVPPTLPDLDADGSGDFASFDETRLSGGVWRLPTEAALSPTGGATGLPGVTRLRLRWRDRTAGDAGVRLDLRFGGVAERHAAWAVIRGDADAQRLSFGAPGGGLAAGLWVEAEAEPDAWVEVGLVLDAGAGRVSVEVDGAPAGSFAATPLGGSGAPGPELAFASAASGGEVDELELVGGGAP